jgi:hypothetical protein
MIRTVGPSHQWPTVDGVPEHDPARGGGRRHHQAEQRGRDRDQLEPARHEDEATQAPVMSTARG